MLTSIDLRAVLHLLARNLDRARVVAGEDQPGERARAGDVGALADVDEQRIVVDGQRLESGEAHRAGAARRRQLTRARDRRALQTRASTASRAATLRGGRPSTAAAIARICSGVVPQQPPTMLTKPLRANSPMQARRRLRRLVVAGVAHRVRQAGVRIARRRTCRRRARAPRCTGASAPRPARS